MSGNGEYRMVRNGGNSVKGDTPILRFFHPLTHSPTRPLAPPTTTTTHTQFLGPDMLGLVPQLWAVLYKQYQEELRSRLRARGEEKEKESQEKGSNTMSCPGKHGLLPFDVPRAGFFCDGCRATVSMGAAMNGCRVCDFDLCPQCSESARGGSEGKGETSEAKDTTRRGKVSNGSMLNSLDRVNISNNLDAEFRTRLGHRVTGLNCGGATPMPHVQAWLKRVFTQCYISENYASTEAGPITNSYGNEAGRISKNIKVKLIAFEGYTPQDQPFPRGEILVKTSAGACAYLNRPDLTESAWDADGYFHTGDIGEMPDAEHVRIIDRKKNIFKLSNGMWVSPENVEAVYTGMCPSVAQVMIHGDSKHNNVVAVVVPVVAGVGAVEMIAEMKAAGEKATLQHYEVPLAVHVLEYDGKMNGGNHVGGGSGGEGKGGEEGSGAGGKDGGSSAIRAFTVDNGLLTQTSKLCRYKIGEAFKAELEGLYLRMAEIEAAAAAGQTGALVSLLRKGMAHRASITAADDDAWAALEWDSLKTLLATNIIKAEFQVEVSFREPRAQGTHCAVY